MQENYDMRQDYEWQGERRRKRILLLALIVVILVGLGTWGGVAIGSSSTAEEKVALEYELSSIQSEYEALRESNEALQAEYSRVQSQYETFSKDYEALREQLTGAEEQSSLLQEDFEDLQDKYVSLASIKQFNVDNRLRISFTTEEQFLSSRWIAGEVINIDSTTVKKAYVFIFRYNPDGSLAKGDFPPIVIANLGPSETAHFSFLAAGEAFKIMAVGNY